MTTHECGPCDIRYGSYTEWVKIPMTRADGKTWTKIVKVERSPFADFTDFMYLHRKKTARM